MAKIQSGVPIDGIPANDWNRFVDASDRVLGGQEVDRRRFPDELAGTGLVLVKNNSGSDVTQFRAMGIGGVEIAPADNLEEFKSVTVLDGETPLITTHIGRFVVAQEDIASGDIGIAAISGITVVEVDVPGTDYGWPFIDIKNSTALLTASWHGAAEIVAGPWTDSGKRWAVARLSNYRSQRPAELARTQLHSVPRKFTNLR